jgi:hypothetical protein
VEAGRVVIAAGSPCLPAGRAHSTRYAVMASHNRPQRFPGLQTAGGRYRWRQSAIESAALLSKPGRM